MLLMDLWVWVFGVFVGIGLNWLGLWIMSLGFWGWVDLFVLGVAVFLRSHALRAAVFAGIVVLWVCLGLVIFVILGCF